MKNKMTAFLTILICFVIIVGGWFCIKEMLRQDAENMLNQKGVLVDQEPETLESHVFKDEIDNRENNLDTKLCNFHGRELTEDELADVLIAWDKKDFDLSIREPGEGQMSMEQAIAIGQDWVRRMSTTGVYPENLSDGVFDKTKAKLYRMEQDTSLDPELLSFWQVSFSEGDIFISISIHAASGQVCEAYISKDKNELMSESLLDEQIIAIAYPFLDKDSKRITADVRRSYAPSAYIEASVAIVIKLVPIE